MHRQVGWKRRLVVAAAVLGLLALAWADDETTPSTPIESLWIYSTTPIGGDSTFGAVFLSSWTPTDVVVTLTSDSPLVIVPPQVTVLGGTSGVSFELQTLATETTTSVTITASANGSTVQQVITVWPANFAPPPIASVTFYPDELLAGETAGAVTVTLAGPAPAGGVPVTVRADSSLLVVTPEELVVPQGRTQITFTAFAPYSDGPAQRIGSVTAMTADSSMQASVPINYVRVVSLAFEPSAVVGGTSVVGTITLSSPAPATGLFLRLYRDYSVPYAQLPGDGLYVYVAPGAIQQSFLVYTFATPSEVSSLFSVDFNGHAEAAITIRPPSAARIVVALDPVQGGYDNYAEIRLDGPAPVGTVVTLASSASSVIVPPSITLPYGESVGRFTFTTRDVVRPTDVTISATFRTRVDYVLTVVPPLRTGPNTQHIYVAYDYMVLHDQGTACVANEPFPGDPRHQPSDDCNPDQLCIAGVCRGHSHAPDPMQIERVVHAFAAQGIKLVVDPQHRAIPETRRMLWSSGPTPCDGADAINFFKLKADYYRPHHNNEHYAIFGHASGCADHQGQAPDGTPLSLTVPGQSGVAEIGGYNFLISLGVFTGYYGTPFEAFARSFEGPTFMHELGHNLGLLHGGDEDKNQKPNYVSVMNYLYSSRGIIEADGVGSSTPAKLRLDFSRQVLPVGGNTPGRLEEAGRLHEPAGLGSGTRDMFWYQDATCTMRLAPTHGPIDWNGDGDTLDTNATAEITPDSPCSPNPTGVHRGFDDWSFIRATLASPKPPTGRVVVERSIDPDHVRGPAFGVDR